MLRRYRSRSRYSSAAHAHRVLSLIGCSCSRGTPARGVLMRCERVGAECSPSTRSATVGLETRSAASWLGGYGGLRRTTEDYVARGDGDDVGHPSRGDEVGIPSEEVSASIVRGHAPLRLGGVWPWRAWWALGCGSSLLLGQSQPPLVCDHGLDDGCGCEIPWYDRMVSVSCLLSLVWGLG